MQARLRRRAWVAAAVAMLGVGGVVVGGASADAASAAPQEWVWDSGVGLWGLWSWDGSRWVLTATQAPGALVAIPVPAPSSTPPAPSPWASSSTGQTTGARSWSGEVLEGDLASKFWPGHTAHWVVATPVGVPRGTVIVLHGKTDSARKASTELDLAGAARSSGYALAAIDGESSFWTAFGGVDTGSMVTEEFVPLLAQKGLPTDRIGLTGYSMGGAGSLTLAEKLGPSRVFGVAPMSAAVWESGHDGAEGQVQAQVRADAGKLAGVPVRIVCGTDDDLIAANRSMAALVPGAVTEWQAGGHDFAYWRPALRRQLSWLAQLPS